MTRKQRFLLGAALLAACIVVAGFAVSTWPEQSAVTEANLNCVQPGMSMEEVEAVFGEPGIEFHGYAMHRNTVRIWANEDGSFADIVFTDGVVAERRWHASNETMLQKLGRWLRLRK